MARFVALLRGINVGRHNRVAMADLRQLLTDLGHTGVRTHLNSGNAVFAGRARSPAAVARAIEAELQARLGRAIRVFVRTGDELAAVVAANPLPTTDPSRLLVVFLDGPPDAAALHRIDLDAYAPERMAAGRREVYLWLPSGITGSALLKAIGEQRVDAAGTARNWATVTRLLSLVEATSDGPPDGTDAPERRR